MKHLMIDLETLSTAPNAVILQIGAVRFDPMTCEVGNSLQINVDIDSCLRLGMKIDDATFRWWMRQADTARLSVAGESTASIVAALISLKQFAEFEIEAVWSHGASFDIPILENAFRVANLDVPWHYRAPRDTRTLFWLAEQMRNWQPQPTEDRAHTAAADAVAQAWEVCAAYQTLRFATEATGETEPS